MNKMHAVEQELHNYIQCAELAEYKDHNKDM